MKRLLVILILFMTLLTLPLPLSAFGADVVDSHDHEADGHAHGEADSEVLRNAVVTREESTDPKRAGKQADFYAKIRSGSEVSAAQNEIAQIIAAHRDVSIAFNE